MSSTPERVWDLVSDITKIGSYSPETFEAEWLGGATGPAVGAKFRGHVKRNGIGPTYWTTCTVTESEPGRVFGFAVGPDGHAVINWRYEITPDGEGATVKESFRLEDILPTRIYWALFGRARGRTNRKNMLATLERIKTEAEAGVGGPPG